MEARKRTWTRGLWSFAIMLGVSAMACRQLAGVDDTDFNANPPAAPSNSAAGGAASASDAGTGLDAGGTADAADDVTDSGAAGTSGGGSSGGGSSAGTGGSAGCAADVTNDGHNCGSCGHDCLGGECLASVCQPLLLAVSPVTVVGLAADSGEGNVYWGSFVDGVIRSCTKTGDGIVTERLMQPNGAVTGVAADADAVYFATYTADDWLPIHGVYRLDKTTWTATELTGGYDGPWDVSSVGTDVYFTNRYDIDEVVRVAKKGGTPDVVLHASKSVDPVYDGPLGLAVDASWVFVSEVMWDGAGGSLLRMRLDGSELQVFDQSSTVTPVIDDGTYVYWEDGLALKRRPVDGSAAATTLETGDAIYAFFVDAKSIRWVTDAGIRSRAKDGSGEITTIAADVEKYVGATNDEVSIFWMLQSSGKLYRLAN